MQENPSGATATSTESVLVTTGNCIHNVTAD